MKKVITFMLSMLIVVSLSTLTTAYAATYSQSIKITIIEGPVTKDITSIETNTDNNKDYSIVNIGYVIKNTSLTEDNTIISVTSNSDKVSLIDDMPTYQVIKTEPIAQSTGSIKVKVKTKDNLPINVEEALTVTFVDNHDTNILPQSTTL